MKQFVVYSETKFLGEKMIRNLEVIEAETAEEAITIHMINFPKAVNVHCYER